MTLRVRWLGRVPYREALAVQQALFDHGRELSRRGWDVTLYTATPRQLIDPAVARRIHVKLGWATASHGLRLPRPEKSVMFVAPHRAAPCTTAKAPRLTTAYIAAYAWSAPMSAGEPPAASGTSR